MERKMLNIREIAKLAGVGKSTVSRVINNTGYVSEDTRKRIEKVMILRQLLGVCQGNRRILLALLFHRPIICFLMRLLQVLKML